MTNEEIKKALKCCFETACRNCSYLGNPRCNDTICKDALNLITEYEAEIAQLKADNARLTAKLGQVLLSIDTVKEMNTMCNIDEQNAEIERLKAENACLLKACEGQFTFNTTEDKKYSIFNSVRKEFAEMLKEKLFSVFGKTICSDLDTEDITDIIDELLKEYGK